MSKQLAEIFGCNRRTINRRLIKIFGQERYDELKHEKQIKRMKAINTFNPNFKNEDILKYYKQGLNSMEIASKIGCNPKTVMNRLKRLLTQREFDFYKKQNLNKKMAKLRARR